MKNTRQSISYAAYRDKVLAGWLGKCLGGVVGAPFENHKELKNLPVESLWPKTLAPNDDLDIQVVWLEALQERGVHLTSDDLAEFWQDRCWYNFCEYGIFLHNVQRGIAPPLSGTWNNQYFWESEGCPIRAEIWGYVAPGNPELAAELAKLDGQLDHGGASVQIEQFLAAASAAAMLTDNLNEALAAGVSVVPSDSRVAFAVEDVRRICRLHPNLPQAWRLVIREYGDRDASKAITNHALSLLAWFLGGGDFKQTMQLCVNSGWDTDCTAATAGALLGALGGTASLPTDWVEKLGPKLLCGIKVRHNETLLTAFAEETCLVGVEMAAQRNSAVTITNAPAVAARRVAASVKPVTVEYVDDPVLWNARPTRVRVNGTVLPPPGIRCEPGPDGIVTIQREQTGGWIADKNLFEVKNGTSRRVFGLGGARQWQVYGPYWDMWDRQKNELCPYNNEKVVCCPNSVGMLSDSYNQYVDLDRAYLDEAHLLREDLPDELPLRMENGVDLITDRQLGGFKGQACYYLVRTIRVQSPVKAGLHVGRSGPFRAWLDGRELVACKEMRGWVIHESDGVAVDLTGQPQRLVVKLVRLTDAFQFSTLFLGHGDPEHKRGISYIYDCLEDLAI